MLKLSDDDIRDVRYACDGATQDLRVGRLPTQDPDEIASIMASAVRARPPGPFYGVFASDHDGRSRFALLTGNGPQSRGNAHFFAVARSALPEALDDIATLKAALAKADETLAAERAANSTLRAELADRAKNEASKNEVTSRDLAVKDALEAIVKAAHDLHRASGIACDVAIETRGGWWGVPMSLASTLPIAPSPDVDGSVWIGSHVVIRECEG